MRILKLFGKFSVAAACGLLPGCGSTWSVSYDESVDASVSDGWHAGAVQVEVPEDLTVTDINTLVPDADIVWHGDPPGDRKAQVAEIVRAGVTEGADGLDGTREVDFHVLLSRFHGVTPAAVALAPSAVHNIDFTIQAVDSDTGEELTEPVEISADVEANLGAIAVFAAMQGEAEKDRIIERIAEVTAGWLGIGPDPRGEFKTLGQ
ncbi:hypothetical protein DEA8626_03891 [Defluviimonas aquaemixtae]|uniref:Uncharacterized protein n=1 Tax=Albidovulum aquaemixtae TaxID=1542388 RepID=A0A2R8BN51_9RHOB|nr:DUF6778 family protein [Defluviimonas aquaemixtae]SPH24857.1 hypothetical protein DEA8626_03891 [Defluviimonas aquaemixtae]